MKEIKGYEGRYMITRCGRVYSTYKKGYLSPKIDKDGYQVVHLQKNGRSKYFLVHRLVAETFLSNPENKPQVNHKDGNKENNNVFNLEWATGSENQKHAYKLGLKRPLTGSNSPRSKLNEEDVIQIRKQLKSGISPKKIAEQYGVVPGTIYLIKNNTNWKKIV